MLCCGCCLLVGVCCLLFGVSCVLAVAWYALRAVCCVLCAVS